MCLNSDAATVLSNAHRRLRRGDFGDDLLDIVRTHGDAWRCLPCLDLRLKGSYVEAEVLDYFGHYAEAAEKLLTYGAEQREELVRRVRAGTHDDENLDVSKRRIWVALAYATTLYRKERHSDALVVLKDCGACLQALDPDERALYGTRARLAYSRGQVFRQLHDYASARREFEVAIVLARQRFIIKTPYAELPALAASRLSPDEHERFERDRLLAHGTIGKCLALGLGWIASTIGQLSSASVLLSAGYTLLRGTGDGLHRAYAMLLIGAVERARAGDDPVRLSTSIAFMKDGAKGLARHPAYSLRACYELALAYYRHPQHRDEARRQIKTFEAGLNGTERRSARWMSAALVIESRMERLEGNLKAAERLAQQAVNDAQKAGDDQLEIQAEALIALGEAFLEEARDAEKRHTAGEGVRYREHAIDRFHKALVLGGDNPKIAAVSHFHLARAHCLHGSLAEAHAELSAAKALEPIVEQGFVLALGEAVTSEISRHDCFFIDGRVATLKKEDHLAALDAFLLRQAKARGVSPSEWATNMGVAESTIKKMQSRLAKLGHKVGERRPAGRPPKNRSR